jgi:uncharacterized protein
VRQIVISIAVLYLGLSTPAWAEGPSFDCAKAATAVEKTICASGDLSALDLQIADEYKAALSSGQTNVAEQRVWLEQRDKACLPENTVNCLRQVLLDRHSFLTGQPDKYTEDSGNSGSINGFPTNVIEDKREREKRIAGFNDPPNDFHKADGMVLGCEGDVMEVFAGQNHSYGALCTVDKNGAKTRAIVCNDEMVGHHHTQDAAGRKIGRKEIAGFIARNCVGG